MKLCVDCKHSRLEISGKISGIEFLKCAATPYGETDLETGQGKKQYFIYCSTLRDHGFPLSWLWGTCGKSGRFFEPKDTANG